MLVAIIGLIIFIALGTCISQIFKFKQEASITIAFLAISLFLYITGLFNLMKYAVYLIYILTLVSIIYIIYCLIKKKIKIQQIITPGVLLYSIVMIGMTILVKNTGYYEWDEFSHWGANLKAMVQYDLFWSNNIYDGVHVVYTPIAGIVEYFFCKLNGGFAEDISYIGINAFIITLLLPICKDEKYSIKNITKLILFWIAIYCIIILNNFKLSSIYIDLLLGVLFGVGMFLAYRLDGKEDKINLFLILITMPLLKDTGLLLLGIILMQLFFNKVVLEIIKDKKITKKHFKTFGIIVLLLIIPLVFYGTWKIYCGSNGRVLDDRHDKNAISDINLKEFTKALMLIKTDNTKYVDISRSFYDALNEKSIIGKLDSNFTTIKVFSIINIITFILYLINKDEKTKKKIATMLIAFDIGFFLYLLLLLATFMFAFTETEGRNLASYERYISTYFIAWGITTLAISLNSKLKNELICCLIAIMLCIYPTSAISLVSVIERKGQTGITPEIALEASIIKENVELKDKVYIIYQNDGGGYEYHKLRYSISPIRTNLMYEWSLGPKYYESDIWSYDITKEKFEKKLIDEQFNYVFIAQVDEQFVNIYGDLINYKLTTQNMKELENKLLSVEKTSENTVVLNIIK